jgi:membrane protein DedA with SNARE-associated domain
MDPGRAGINPAHAALYRLAATAIGIGLTTAIGGVAVVAVYYPLRHAHFGFQWLVVFVLMTFESMAVHLPSEVILPLAGWLIVREHDLGYAGIAAVSVIAAFGNTAGSLLLYVAGRRGGRPLVRRFGRYFLLDERDLDAAADRLRSRGPWAVLVTRLLPVVRTYAGFVAGMLRMPVGPFVMATFTGSLAWSAAFVALGAALGSNWDAVRGPAEVAGIVALALLLIAAGATTALQLRGRRATG